MLDDVREYRTATELPAIGGALPPAWADRDTRRVVRRQAWGTAAFLLMAVAGATATVLVAALGMLAEPWGLAAMVAAGGLAGGALAGGITQLVLCARLRSFLRNGPWFNDAMTLREGRYATLTHGPDSVDVQLDVATARLGEPGDRLAVRVRSDGGPHLIAMPRFRRIVRAVDQRS